MKVREMLKIQEALENKSIPDDILNGDNFYWSESKETHINILDLDLHHLIRILIKNLDADKKTNRIEILNSLNTILDQSEKIRKSLYE
jgi:hypothetical protein